MSPRLVVIAGPSTSGKSSLCNTIHLASGWPIVRADEYHDSHWRNNPRSLMRKERAAWEEVVLAAVRLSLLHHETTILDCSAVRQAFQERLLDLHDEVTLIVLSITRETAFHRLEGRRREGSHFFCSEELIEEQLQIMQMPTPGDCVHVVDANRSADEVLDSVSEILNLHNQVPTQVC